jgi:hypothetical protein
MGMSKHTEGTDPTKPIGHGNPPKATQFGQKDANPRASGVWRKEDTPRYKLEQMITLTKAEIQLIIDDSTAPMFERQLADAIMHADWNILERTINQVYGPPVQRIEQTNIPAPIPLLDLDEIKAKARALRGRHAA